MEKLMYELTKRTPLIIIGIISIAIAAIGSIPLSNPPFEISAVWQIIFAVLGVLLIGAGIILAFREKRDIQPQKEQVIPMVPTYYQISLPQTHQFNLPPGNQDPPLKLTFDGIPFYFVPGSTNRPVGLQLPFNDDINIPLDVPRVKSVHFLLNAEYAFKDLGNGVAGRHRQIGEIELCFTNSNSIRQPIILGVNIRDWFFKNLSAITDWEPEHNAYEVWRGDGDRGLIIDLLSIDCKKIATLRQIIIRNRLVSNVPPIHKPGILIWAITCTVSS